MNTSSNGDDPEPSLWRVSLIVDAGVVNAYEEALTPYCQAVSCIANETSGDAEDGTEGPPKGDWQIEGFSESKPDTAALARAVAVVADAFDQAVPHIDINPVEQRDWVLDGLRMFPPIHAGRYYIYGSHSEDPIPAGRIGICLNPGRAFGSGDHATTQGCLLALDDLARTRQPHRMLDMGCGSGILAIAMARTWAHSMTAPVMASDNDRKAVPVAAENIHNNGVAARVRALAGDGYKSEKIIAAGPYDLIVSNILANPLRRMAKDLGRNLRSAKEGGGFVILSGLLARDSKRVMAAHRHLGLRLVRYYDIKGWRTLVLQRPGR